VSGEAITVVVPTADRPQALRRCVDALLAGTRLPDRLVVVDQSADNASVRALAGVAGRVDLCHLRTRRLGLSGARNEGVRHASAPLVAFVDDDCAPSPGWLEAVALAFASPSRPGIVAGPVLPLGPPRRGLSPVSSRAVTASHDVAADVLPWVVGTGGNMAFRLDGRGRLFDERLGAGSAGRAAEDVDVVRRLMRDGVGARVEAGAIVFHGRQSRRRRLRSRFGYGHGVGAACMFWARQRDAYAGRALRGWLVLRLRMAAAGVRGGNPWAVPEEALMIVGTAVGIGYGLRAARA
jgi:GT2 family glycosyltransferase